MKKNIFIIGSKGIPAKYGGFETFVEYLTLERKNKQIQYHVSCLGENNEQFTHNNARCFNVKVGNIGSAKAVLYDVKSLSQCVNYIKKNNINNAIVYILACRIGPVIFYYKKILNNLGVKVYVNPDGHEWKRSKWNSAIREYWKLSERLMVKHADMLICDSKGIESFIKEEYKKYLPKTIYISYGADIKPSALNDSSNKIVEWYKKYNIKSNDYYLIVGRFVPENNYETLILEFMKSSTKKDLVIITNVEKNNFYNDLLEKTKFNNDKRVKFVGTVYDQELLKKIRESAFAYLHGHEVGGTNPSLLEALASTKVNILLDVVFNKEVGNNGALYFNKEQGSLSTLIERVDNLRAQEINELSEKAINRIKQYYSWEKIVNDYEELFINS